MSATSEGVGTALTRQGLALQVLSLRGKKMFDNQIKYDGLGGRDNALVINPPFGINIAYLYIIFFFLSIIYSLLFFLYVVFYSLMALHKITKSTIEMLSNCFCFVVYYLL